MEWFMCCRKRQIFRNNGNGEQTDVSGLFATLDQVDLLAYISTKVRKDALGLGHYLWSFWGSRAIWLPVTC